MKILGRSPTLVIGIVVALISFAGTLGFRLLSADQAGLWIAVVNAVAGAIVAYTVRPIAPAAFTYLIGSIVALGTAYGLSLTAEQVNGINGLVIPLLSLLTYGNVSPIDTAVSSKTVAAGAPDVQTVPEAR